MVCLKWIFLGNLYKREKWISVRVFCGSISVCDYVCTWCRGQRMMSAVFLECSPPYFLRQHLSQSLKLIYSARLAGQWAPGIFVSKPPFPMINDECYCGQPFVWGLEPWILILVQQALYLLSYLSVPRKFVFCFLISNLILILDTRASILLIFFKSKTWTHFSTSSSILYYCY